MSMDWALAALSISLIIAAFAGLRYRRASGFQRSVMGPPANLDDRTDVSSQERDRRERHSA